MVYPSRTGPHPFDPLSLRERGDSVRPSFPLSRRERGTGGEDPESGGGGAHTTFPIGSFLMRFPVAAKIACATAGAIGGVPGSPTPPCASVLGTMYTSTFGISARRSIW